MAHGIAYRRSMAQAGGSRASDAVALPYVVAHYGKSLLWCASESLFAFLLTELAHLSPLAVGWVLAGTFLLSGGLDICVGGALRHRMSTAAACARLQLGGAVVSALAMVMLFSVPALHLTAPLAVATASIILFRTAYAFVDIPQNAMLSLLGNNDARTSLASARLVASGLGALTVAASVAALVYSSDADRPRLLILFSSVIALVTIASSAHLRRRVLAGAAAPAQASAPAPATVARRLPIAAWRLILLMLVANFAAPVFGKILPYYADYQLRDPLLGSSAISLLSLGGVVGPRVWYILLRGRSADTHVAMSSLAVAVAAALFGLSDWAGSAALVPAAGLLGLSAGGLGMSIWSAFGLVIAEAGRGWEGLAYGLLTAAAKTALALDAIGMGWLMSNPSFREPSSPRLLLYMTIPPIVAGIAVAVLILLWRGSSRKTATALDQERG
ncbi:MFS transporter [Sphingomonas nostoxanthinifaciens]|uniref:MFS transporter n=1 Tax=Sphingomonas nostoxanthinifaciens TaxID=2872652 RepID=UPI001CC1DE85|nr:MFS transporter [Sphingomonas nostoxanthinifaciens]UAK25774.1 MFS transporter [Sphingomonas nostoxanthinifaciens]